MVRHIIMNIIPDIDLPGAQSLQFRIVANVVSKKRSIAHNEWLFCDAPF